MNRQELYQGSISWMARNPVAANLLMVALLVGGLMSTCSIRKEVFPQIEMHRIFISMVYPGASPSEVEQGIILAIEEAVRPIDGVKEVRSRAAENAGSVTVELEENTDRTKALADVKNAVDRITSFPQEAERPIVNMPEIRPDAIKLVLYGDQDERVLHAYAEQVREQMLQYPEISFVELGNTKPMEISVEIPQETLRRYGLTLPQVAQTIRRTALELPAGGVKSAGGETLLRTAERRNLAQEFTNISVLSGTDGTALMLGDIAEIKDGFADVDIAAFFEGKRAVLLDVFSVGNQSPTEVATAVKEFNQSLQGRLPPGMFSATWQDRAKMYDERLDLLQRNAALGLALVLLILGLFLEPKLAFWVTMGIPISFLGSLLLLPSLGVSINMISLFAFIVTLGMVVDDAIVVGENAFRFRREGNPPLKAAILGARQVATPVFFSIATTIAAFAPLLFIPGTRGKFVLAIPIVVICVLALSLIESFFILPAHLGHLRERDRKNRTRLGRAQVSISRNIERFIKNRYLPLVRFAVHQRWITLAIAVAIFILAFGLVKGGRVKVIDFPKEESDWVICEAHLSFGSSVKQTEALMDHLVQSAKQVIDKNGGERISQGIFSMLGVSFGRHGGRSSGGHVASVFATLVPSSQRDISSSEFASQWRRQIGDVPGMELLSFDSSTGHTSKPIDLELSHSNIAILEQAAFDLANKLRDFEGLKDIDNGIELGKPQLNYTLSAEGINAKLTAADLAGQVRAAFYGAEALRQQRGRNEVRVMVRFPKNERENLGSVEDFIVMTPVGGQMPLRRAANVAYGRAYTKINRTDGRRTARIQADVEEKKANAQEVMGSIYREIMPGLKAKYPGLAYGSSGRQKQFQDFIQYIIFGFTMALLVMYLLIAIPLKSYLQPLFVVMLPAILFGFVGAVLGHLLMGMAISMISLMGIVALSGVVINDALVLVVAANRFRREHSQAAVQAATNAAHQRFRPVILTSLTTFGGLAPMIFETSVQARVLIPMAVSLGFGILFSTTVVLFLMPCLYVMIDGLSLKLKGAYAWLFPADTHAIDESDVTATQETP